MSHSPANAKNPQPNARYERGWQRMTELIETGGSWSGRERHCCFLNTGKTGFADISAVSGLDFIDDGRAVALVDWDHDGDLDIVISNRTGPRIRFLRNDAGTGNHYLAVRLVGRTCNRDAIGARLELVLSDSQGAKRIKTLTAGDGFLSQSSKAVHFGLGRSQTIDRLIVRWPGNKQEEVFRNLQPDRHFRIVQGSGKARLLSFPKRLPFAASEWKTPATARSIRLPLMEPVPMPNVDYTDFRDNPRSLKEHGGPVLINLWASWCAPCAAELRDFANHSRAFKDRGVSVVALSVDGLRGDEQTNRDDAKKFVDKLKVPFTTGAATPELLDKLDVMQDVVASIKTRIDRASSIPIPASFLLDSSGRLAVIYNGRISVETLLEDVAGLQRGESLALPFPGRWFLRPDSAGNVLVRFADRFIRRGYPNVAGQYASLIADLSTRAGNRLGLDRKLAAVYNDLGNLYDQNGDGQTAERQFQRALQIVPDYPEAHTNLGNIRLSRSQFAEAREHYLRALAVKPNLLPARMNLGSLALQQKRYAEAADCFRLVLKFHPQNPPAHTFLGRALYQQGKTNEAKKHIAEALRINPGYAPARQFLETIQSDANR